MPDRFSDWLLWKIPELRGRIAYDVRFEIYDKEFFDRLGDYNWEQGADWKSFADGYRIIVVDETNRSHTADFLKEPGARVIYRGDELTVIARPSYDADSLSSTAAAEDDDALALEDLLPGRVRLEPTRRTPSRPSDAA